MTVAHYWLEPASFYSYSWKSMCGYVFQCVSVICNQEVRLNDIFFPLGKLWSLKCYVLKLTSLRLTSAAKRVNSVVEKRRKWERRDGKGLSRKPSPVLQEELCFGRYLHSLPWLDGIIMTKIHQYNTLIFSEEDHSNGLLVLVLEATFIIRVFYFIDHI